MMNFLKTLSFALLALGTMGLVVTELSRTKSKETLTSVKKSPMEVDAPEVDWSMIKDVPKNEGGSRVKSALEKLAQNPSKLREIPKIGELSPEKIARMEEVREVMEWMDSQGMLSDDTQIEKILTRLKETAISDTEALYSDLDLLQDFLRQIDNGETFGKMSGFELLLKLINPSNTIIPDGYEKVAAMAAIDFNAAIQNNPKAIALALKADGLRSLTDSLRFGLGLTYGVVAKRLVSTISSLIRDTPDAQEQFLTDMDGAGLLMTTLKKFKDDHSVTQKVLLTVTDLITSDHAAPVAAFKNPVWLNAISEMLASENLDLVEQALRFFTVFPLNHHNTPEKLKGDVEKLRSSFTHDLEVESDKDLEGFDEDLLELTEIILDKLIHLEKDEETIEDLNPTTYPTFGAPNIDATAVENDHHDKGNNGDEHVEL